jgi:hypothetical protein
MDARLAINGAGGRAQHGRGVDAVTSAVVVTVFVGIADLDRLAGKGGNGDASARRLPAVGVRAVVSAVRAVDEFARDAGSGTVLQHHSGGHLH